MTSQLDLALNSIRLGDINGYRLLSALIDDALDTLRRG